MKGNLTEVLKSSIERDERIRNNFTPPGWRHELAARMAAGMMANKEAWNYDDIVCPKDTCMQEIAAAAYAMADAMIAEGKNAVDIETKEKQA